MPATRSPRPTVSPLTVGDTSADQASTPGVSQTPVGEAALLETLTSDYFRAVETVKDIHNEAERKIAALREREELRAKATLADADAIIVHMLDLGMSKTEVSERLGVANRHIRRAIETHR